VVTFQLVCLGWVFFRADSMSSAFAVLGRLIHGWGEGAALVTPAVAGTIITMLVLQNLPRTPADAVQRSFSRLVPVLQGAAFAAALFAITSLGPQGVSPFIYFRF
jgi:hypothetical protein